MCCLLFLSKSFGFTELYPVYFGLFLSFVEIILNSEPQGQRDQSIQVSHDLQHCLYRFVGTHSLLPTNPQEQNYRPKLSVLDNLHLPGKFLEVHQLIENCLNKHGLELHQMNQPNVVFSLVGIESDKKIDHIY